MAVDHQTVTFIMLASVSIYQTDCMFPMLRRVLERIDQQRRM